jgi:hypothetical protein
MSEETLNTVSRDLIPMEDYFKRANQGFQQQLEVAEKK